jgi:hypothetical protein
VIGGDADVFNIAHNDVPDPATGVRGLKIGTLKNGSQVAARCATQERLVPSEFVCDPGRLRLRRAGALDVPISPTSRGEPADRVGQCRFGRAGQVP